jgi:hypothetical protein
MSTTAAATPRRRPRAYLSSMVYSAIKAVSEGSLTPTDGRSAEARALRELARVVLTDAGRDVEGASAGELSTVRTIADLEGVRAVIARVIHEKPDALVNRRKRTVAPVVAEYLRVTARLEAAYQLVHGGTLARKARPVLSASAIIAARRAQGATTAPPPTDTPSAPAVVAPEPSGEAS